MNLKIEMDIGKIFKFGYDKLSKFNIGNLLLLSLALHLFAMSFPSDGGMIFDEAHYVPAALTTLQLQPANAEHTPLAKIVIAISIAIFGNYWFAWRFPIVIMCLISLYIFYRIAQRFMPENYALLATAFLSFDIIYFIHGSIFVLNMPAIMFGLLGIERYLAKSYKWSAVAFGISFLMYEVELLFLGAILIYHVATQLKGAYDSSKTHSKSYFRNINLKKFTTFLIVLLLVGGGGLWLYDAVYKPTSGATIYENVIVDQDGIPITTETITNYTGANVITNPVQHIQFMWNYFSSLAPVLATPASDYRPPWDWILPTGNSLNPPHYFTISITENEISHTIIDWQSQITPFVEYFLIPIVAIALFNIIKKKDEKKLGLFLLSWIIATYIPFLLLGIIAYPHWTNFNYYVLPTIPACALGIPYFWASIPMSDRSRKYCLFIHLILTIAFFIYFFPVVLIR